MTATVNFDASRDIFEEACPASVFAAFHADIFLDEIINPEDQEDPYDAETCIEVMSDVLPPFAILWMKDRMASGDTKRALEIISSGGPLLTLEEVEALRTRLYADRLADKAMKAKAAAAAKAMTDLKVMGF